MGLLGSADSKNVALNREEAFLSSGPSWVPACLNIGYEATASFRLACPVYAPKERNNLTRSSSVCGGSRPEDVRGAIGKLDVHGSPAPVTREVRHGMRH